MPVSGGSSINRDSAAHRRRSPDNIDRAGYAAPGDLVLRVVGVSGRSQALPVTVPALQSRFAIANIVERVGILFARDQNPIRPAPHAIGQLPTPIIRILPVTIIHRARG